MARPRKISETELFDIINKYTSDTPYLTSLKYSELVKYAKTELGYEYITYQDFSRNKSIKEFVDLYKQRKEMTSYTKLNSEKVERFDFNADILVDRYQSNPKQLKAVLKVFKEAYDKTFDLLSDYEKTTVKNAGILEEQEKIMKELREKNTELRKQLNSQKEYNSSSYRIQKLKWMYLLLTDMIMQNNYYIETESEIMDILKNFGYSSSDVVDVKKIIEEEFTEPNIVETSDLNKAQNINKTNEKNEDNNVVSFEKNKIQLPSFMKK